PKSATNIEGGPTTGDEATTAFVSAFGVASWLATTTWMVQSTAVTPQAAAPRINGSTAAAGRLRRLGRAQGVSATPSTATVASIGVPICTGDNRVPKAFSQGASRSSIIASTVISRARPATSRGKPGVSGAPPGAEPAGLGTTVAPSDGVWEGADWRAVSTAVPAASATRAAGGAPPSSRPQTEQRAAPACTSAPQPRQNMARSFPSGSHLRGACLQLTCRGSSCLL